TQGEIRIQDSLNLFGPGASKLTVDASGNDSTPDVDDGLGSSIFRILGEDSYLLPDVNLSSLTLTGADARYFGGGAIASQGNLVINDCLITGNHSETVGGAISVRVGTLTIA